MTDIRIKDLKHPGDFVCEESNDVIGTSTNNEKCSEEIFCKSKSCILLEGTTMVTEIRQDEKNSMERLREEKSVGEDLTETTDSGGQLEVREMDKNVNTAEDIEHQMDSAEENSVLLIRGDDPQIQQMEEENQRTSEKETTDEETLHLEENKNELAMKCEDLQRKIRELEEEKITLTSMAKSYEREISLQRNYKTKIKKKCEMAIEKQKNEGKVQHLEVELKDLAIKYKNCRVRNQRLDNQIRENAKKCESFERKIQELQVKNNHWERKNKLYQTELLKFKGDMSELTTLALCLNTHIQQKHERNLHLAQDLQNYESKLKELKETKDGITMENKKNEEKVQQLEEKLKEVAIKYENCEMRNQWLDNQVNEQARKCEDFERKIQNLEEEKRDWSRKGGSYEREIQHREGECNTPATTSEESERQIQVLKEDKENLAMTAEYYVKKVQELEEANQRLSQKELIYEKKICQMEEEKNVLVMTSECHETMVQLLKEEMKKMAENEERIEMKLDQLEMQNSDLKNICKRLLKKTKKKKSLCYLFRRGQKNEANQAKETKVEMKPDKEGKKKKKQQQKKKKGGLMKWIHGLWT